MNQYVGGQQGGTSGGDYQKYMNQYAGGQQGGTSGGDYQSYMKQYVGGGQQGGGDYQQYMQQYTGGQKGSTPGGYEQYINQYASGSQTDGDDGSVGSKSPYMDASAESSALFATWVQGQKNATSEQQQRQYADSYIKAYASQYIPDNTTQNANKDIETGIPLVVQ